MSNKKQEIPAIRFNGFTDAWEQCKFSQYYKVSSGFAFKLEDYTEIGVPIVNGESIQHGVVSSNKFNYLPDSFRNKYPQYVLNTGDIVLGLNRPVINGELKIAKIPEKLDKSLLYQRAGKVEYIRPISKKFSFILLDKEILKYTLKEAVGSDQPFISTTKLAEWKMFVPSSNDEMEKLGIFFNLLNNAIALHQRKLDKAKELKSAYLSEMFPAEGERKPKRRFAGFTDDWEQRKLGDHCEMFNGDRSSKYPNAQDMVSDGIPFINAGDLENGHVNLKTAKKISRGKYDELSGAKLQLGDIVYCLRGTLGKNAYIDNFDKGTVASSLVAIRPKNIDGRYLYYILNSDIEYKQRIVHDEGAAQPNLSAKSVSEFVMPVPDIDEQKKISAYFSNLDHLIALHQRQLDNYKELKKAMMQNIFNKKLRFKNGNGNEFPEWKKKKLNNFCSVTTGKLDANAMKENGVYKFFTCSHQDYLIDTYAFEGESLIIAGNGDVGHIKYYNGKFNAYQRTYILQNFENISAVYLKNNLENELPRRIQRETQQSAMVYIKLSTLTEAEIDVPIMEEQNIIGDFLSKFDSMIAKQEKIIDLFKEQKKVLMQKMFV